MKKFFSKIAQWMRRYDESHNFTCDICGREVFGGERVCAACRAQLPFNGGHACPLCGRKVLEAGVCIECKDSRPVVEKARSCFVHEGSAAALVLQFKKGKRYLVRALSGFLLPVLEAQFPDADALVFVPMTKRARRRRGYNQARLLAGELSRSSGVPLLDAAEKRRETAAQKALGRREREKNLEGCFRVTDRSAVRGKRIVIVDDTFTTGATVNELARVFYRAGARSVCALTVTSVPCKINKTANA